MDLDNQRVIKQLADENGPSEIVVVLGATNIESVKITAETLTESGPSFVGPLVGVQLGLQVYHILEPAIKAIIPKALYEEKLAMTEMITDVEAIQKVLQRIRDKSGIVESDKLERS